MRFVHLTDPHLTPDGKSLYGINPLERFNKAIRDINRECADAEFMVITGDLVHGGKISGYKALRSALNQLHCPYYLVIGNHDNRNNLRKVFPELPIDNNGFVQYVIETNGSVLIILDTQIEGSHSGTLYKKRLDWLQKTVDYYSKTNVFLFMHHPPFRLPTKNELRNVISLAPVKHLFFGHLHRPLHGVWAGLAFSCMRATNHQIARDLGRTSSTPIGCLEPPGYAIVRFEDDLVIVHEQNFLDDNIWFELRDPKARTAQTISELKARKLDR